MKILSENIRYLRVKHALSQEAFAKLLGVKRSAIGAYETGRASPKLDAIINLSTAFSISLDTILHKSLAELEEMDPNYRDTTFVERRALTLTVDKNNEELVVLISHRLHWAYTRRYDDIYFLRSQPYMKLPYLNPAKSYRAFEASENLVEGVPAGNCLIGMHIDDPHKCIAGEFYIFISAKHGLLTGRLESPLLSDDFFRIYSHTINRQPPKDSRQLLLKDISEIWQVKNVLGDIASLYTYNDANFSDGFPRIQHSINSLLNEIRRLDK